MMSLFECIVLTSTWPHMTSTTDWHPRFISNKFEFTKSNYFDLSIHLTSSAVLKCVITWYTLGDCSMATRGRVVIITVCQSFAYCALLQNGPWWYQPLSLVSEDAGDVHRVCYCRICTQNACKQAVIKHAGNWEKKMKIHITISYTSVILDIVPWEFSRLELFMIVEIYNNDSFVCKYV